MKIDLTALLPTALKPYAKYVYALIGVAVFLVANGLLTGSVAEIVTKVAALVAIPGAVYGAENRSADPGLDETPAQDEYDEDDSADSNPSTDASA